MQAHARRAITDRVGRIVDTRDRLAAVTAELTATTPEPDDEAERDRAIATIADLQKRLSDLGDRHDRLADDRQDLHDRLTALVGEYNRLAAVVRRLAGDRSRFMTVLDQWDTLAGRLAKAAADGQSLSGRDRTIAADWAEWKKTTTTATDGHTTEGDRP